jgi:hypothetical protein
MVESMVAMVLADQLLQVRQRLLLLLSHASAV